MPLRMIDWKCNGKCGRRWENLTTVSSTGAALSPRCCGVLASRIITAPAIRTSDNAPRDLRTFDTAGHPQPGQTVHGRHAWDSQLGKATEGMNAREKEAYAKARGLEIEPASAYLPSHLSKEPPPPRLEDDPALYSEHVDDCSDMYDQWEAGKLPEIETPMLDEDAEARAAVDEMTGRNAEEVIGLAADEQGA